MAASTLRVRAKAGICPRYDLVEQGFNRKVCMRLQAHADAPSGFAWVDTVEEESVPNTKEFRDAIADGALWAVDEDTARAVWGVAWREHFDASFGTQKPAVKGASSAEEKV